MAHKSILWIRCADCGGTGLVGIDGAACVCARAGTRPGWQPQPGTLPLPGGEVPPTLLPLSPAGFRLAEAIAHTKAQLLAETHAPVTDTEALAHLEDACARQDDAEGPYCLQEGGAWCDDHCPFHDWPPDEGPLAWG